MKRNCKIYKATKDSIAFKRLTQPNPPTEDDIRMAGLTVSSILLKSYAKDRDKGAGVVGTALRNLDPKSFQLIYKLVRQHVNRELKALEKKHENSSARRPRLGATNRNGKGTRKRVGVRKERSK